MCFQLCSVHGASGCLRCVIIWVIAITLHRLNALCIDFDIAVYSLRRFCKITSVWLKMLKRRHHFFSLRSLVLHHSCSPLFIRCRNCPLHNVHVLSSTAVSVADCCTVDQSNSRSHLSSPVTRFYTTVCHNLNIRPSAPASLSSRDTCSRWLVANLHSSGDRGYSRLWPNVRWLTLSPKAIVEASPMYVQPYLRLIRLDRPIGMLLKLLSTSFLCLLPMLVRWLAEYHSLSHISLVVA